MCVCVCVRACVCVCVCERVREGMVSVLCLRLDSPYLDILVRNIFQFQSRLTSMTGSHT